MYLLNNIINDKCYIGSATTNKINSRFRNHFIHGTGSKLTNLAKNKYGLENFAFIIIEYFSIFVLKENLNKLGACILRNKFILDSSGCEAKAHCCSFGSSEDAENCIKLSGGHFDVIVGADIGYDVELHDPIKRTLALMSTAATRIILCEEVRWSDIYSWYVETLRELFIVDEIDAPELHTSKATRKTIKMLLLTKKLDAPIIR